MARRSIPDRIVADLRRRIADGALLAGDRLPSTRVLAEQLDVSRGSVVTAYEQLVGEGYLVASRGGTRVNPTLPHPPAPRRPRATGPTAPDVPAPLRPGTPLTGVLLGANWRAAWRAAAAEPRTHPATGSPRLRTLIADHLRLPRSVPVDPADVVVTTGARDGLRLLLGALGRPGRLAVEDPGYPSLRRIPATLGWEVCPVETDREGVLVDALVAAAPTAVLVTPNHQFPSGEQMSAPRRFALLEAARAHGWWVVEDDYDSELRAATSSLLALDPDGRAAMLGSFAKSLTPALGLGYLVVPSALRADVARLALPASGIVQDALANFLAADGLRAHTARLRREDRRRRKVFLGVFPDGTPMEGGLHAVVWLEPGSDEGRAVAASRAAGLGVKGMSTYWSRGGARQGPGIVVGLQAPTTDRLRRALLRLKEVLQALTGTRAAPPPAAR